MSSRTTFLREPVHLALVCTVCLRAFSAATATEPFDRAGNIYVETQEVRVRVPAEVAGQGFAWRAEDIEKPVDWPRRGTAEAAWPLPEAIEIGRVYDFVGRDLGRNPPPRVTSSPMFVLLPPGGAEALPLVKPPSSTWRDGESSSVVLQILAPSSARVRMEDRPWSESYAYGFRPDQASEFGLAVYNFGPRPVGGTVEVSQAPPGWRLSIGKERVDVDPWGREVVRLTFDGSRLDGGEAPTDGWIVIEGKWEGSASSALAFRMKARD